MSIRRVGNEHGKSSKKICGEVREQNVTSFLNKSIFYLRRPFRNGTMIESTASSKETAEKKKIIMRVSSVRWDRFDKKLILTCTNSKFRTISSSKYSQKKKIIDPSFVFSSLFFSFSLSISLFSFVSSIARSNILDKLYRSAYLRVVSLFRVFRYTPTHRPSRWVQEDIFSHLSMRMLRLLVPFVGVVRIIAIRLLNIIYTRRVST